MPAISEGYSRWVQEKKENSINIYLSGFDKRYLQKFVARVSFEACLELDHSFFNDLFHYKNPRRSSGLNEQSSNNPRSNMVFPVVYSQ